jgi:hypothetical protein
VLTRLDGISIDGHRDVPAGRQRRREERRTLTPMEEATDELADSECHDAQP